MRYNANDIKFLTDIEHIQKNPTMWIADYNATHIFDEILDNALDEVLEGYSLEINIYKDANKYTIVDFGRGIPLGFKKFLGKKHLISTWLFSKSFTGAKFSKESAYRYSSTGLHGVGAVVANALSEWLLVLTKRKDEFNMSEFKNGQLLKESFGKFSELGMYKEFLKRESFTLVSFIPSSKYFQNLDLKDYIINRCELITTFIDCKITFKDLQDSITKNFEYKSNNIQKLLNLESPIMKDLIVIEDKKTSEKLIFYYAYTEDEEFNTKSITNLIQNESGTHIFLINDMILESFKELLKNSVTDILQKNDYFSGLKYIVVLFLTDPIYASQSKVKLINPKKSLEEKTIFGKFKDAFKKSIKPYLEILAQKFLEERRIKNELLHKKEVRKVVLLSKTSEDGKIIRKSIVPKLIECTYPYVDGTELFLVEGNSAASTASIARDPKYFAILPLRGKVLNVSKRSYTKNAEVLNIINVLGCGVGDSFDIKNMRYEKVMILCDADPDGYSIAILLINLFVTLFPEIVKSGKLRLILPPLYGYYKDGKFVGVYSLEEIPKNLQFFRFKGLGEMNPDQLKVVIGKESRKEIIVEYPFNEKEFKELFTLSKRGLLEDLELIED